MKIFRVDLASRDEQTSGFLQYFPFWFLFNSSVVFCAINVKTERGPQTQSADDWMISCTIFMWHDTLTWEVFVDENVIRSTVGAVRKDVILGVRRREWKRVDSRDNRIDQPFRQRCVKESVLCKIRRPSLEASF